MLEEYMALTAGLLSTGHSVVALPRRIDATLALSTPRRDYDTNTPVVVSGRSLVHSLRLRTLSAIRERLSEFSADLAQCRHCSATTLVSALGYSVQSGVRVDEVKTNACMATQGWQQAPPSVTGITLL